MSHPSSLPSLFLAAGPYHWCRSRLQELIPGTTEGLLPSAPGFGGQCFVHSGHHLLWIIPIYWIQLGWLVIKSFQHDSLFIRVSVMNESLEIKVRLWNRQMSTKKRKASRNSRTNRRLTGKTACSLLLQWLAQPPSVLANHSHAKISPPFSIFRLGL